jgi:2-oxoglutarate dehydrogenase E2 component (dihydrolipoamide succinyltransferase)
MSTPIKVPALGESVKQAILIKWHKNDGDPVKTDEPLCELETEKANVDLPAQSAGVLHRLKKEGDQVSVGEVIGEIDASAATTQAASAATPQKKQAEQPAAASSSTPSAVALEDYSPAVRRLIQDNKLDPRAIPASGPGGRLSREDVEKYLSGRATPSAAPERDRERLPPRTGPAPTMEKKKDVATTAPAVPAPPQAAMGISFDNSGIHRAPMSKIRKRIAQTLVEAQHNAAILTTFNEVDLTEVIDLRNRYRERFQEVHGVGLGFMSFFARAVVLALKEFPRLNAFIEGDDVVYHQFVHLGIAVATDRGLAVPVLRNADKMTFARIEAEIKRLAAATREGKLALDELAGGTFTVTNGGIFGSLLSTPILNPPQSGILGMHAIQKRPMVINDKIEIRSMMYLALSYDHRLVDGRDSVSFLVRLKQYLEDPARLMLEV